MGQEFEPIINKLIDMGINLNTDTKKERVPEVEWQNRVLKERLHYCCHTLTFKMITKMIMAETINHYYFYIKIFLPKI